MGEPGFISISYDCFCFPVQYSCFTAKYLICPWMSCLRYLTNDSNNFLLRQFPVFQARHCISGPGLNFVIVVQKPKREMLSSSFSITWHQTLPGYDSAVRKLIDMPQFLSGKLTTAICLC